MINKDRSYYKWSDVLYPWIVWVTAVSFWFYAGRATLQLWKHLKIIAALTLLLSSKIEQYTGQSICCDTLIHEIKISQLVGNQHSFVERSIENGKDGCL